MAEQFISLAVGGQVMDANLTELIIAVITAVMAYLAGKKKGQK
jgi:hypothetical protein